MCQHLFPASTIAHILEAMHYIVVGLGNPGGEYANTRHNVGRMVVERVAESLHASAWRDDGKLHAKVGQATFGDTKVTLVLPDNYMNRSGGAVVPLIRGAKQAEQLLVVHDDIDLPLGTIRIVFNRGSGGHRGVESIVRAIKTSAFMRIRVGVLPTTPAGTAKKPRGDTAVHDFILKQISPKDRQAVDALVERSSDAVRACLEHGLDAAMRDFNGSGAARLLTRPARKTARRLRPSRVRT